jgi:DNA-binding NtrC family response regulator
MDIYVYRSSTEYFTVSEELSVEIPDQGINIDEQLARVELAYIEKALKKTTGKKTEAWKLLGYNDRFAMKRRVDCILKKYKDNPRIWRDFPYLAKQYALD